MGQLRQAHCPVGAKPTMKLRWEMLAPLLVGFTIASMAVFALSSIVGSAARSALMVPVPLSVAGVLLLCALADLAFPRIRPTLFNRQTPRELAGRFSPSITGLLWGLDTGSVVSTFRSSAASWAALLLVFAGWGPWWTGAVYAAAFCIPLGLLIVSYPMTDGVVPSQKLRYRGTEAIAAALGAHVTYVRWGAAAVAAFGAYVSIHEIV